MKINVCIEANTIEEYMEAVKALAAGYQVKPVINVTASAKAVVNDEVKVVAEDKPKFKSVAKQKPVKEVSSPSKEFKEENSTVVFDNKTNPSDNGLSFVDVKLKAKQVSNSPDGKEETKFVLDKLGAKKLSDIKEDQYETFITMMDEYLDSTAASKQFSEEMDREETPISETHENDVAEIAKEVTIEMIRGKAKQLAVAGYKEEIKDTLKAFGAPSLTKIKKEDYAAFYNALGEING